MSDSIFWRRLALILRKMPWLVVIAHFFFRLFRPRFTVGVVGVIFCGEGQVLLVEHIFHPRIPWGLPGGWVERNEDPSAAVCREIREELGLTVQASQPLLNEVSHRNHLDIAYLCQISGDDTIHVLSRELLSYRWVSPQELPRLSKFHYHAIMRAIEKAEFAL
jgi:8-oxo-dGTP pyrophosphatase MutT (NUDIX family)